MSARRPLCPRAILMDLDPGTLDIVRAQARFLPRAILMDLDPGTMDLEPGTVRVCTGKGFQVF